MNTKRYQCRHIFTAGHRCGSPSLRNEHFCYYHHTTRKPAPKNRPLAPFEFELPIPEDRAAIQQAIGQILHRIATNQIDPRRAGLLLYGLQIAASILPKPERPTKDHPRKPEPQPVEEIIDHPELGHLAPETEYSHRDPNPPNPSPENSSAHSEPESTSTNSGRKTTNLSRDTTKTTMTRTKTSNPQPSPPSKPLQTQVQT